MGRGNAAGKWGHSIDFSGTAAHSSGDFVGRDRPRECLLLDASEEERLKRDGILVSSKEHWPACQFSPFGEYGDLVLIQASAQAFSKAAVGSIDKHHGDRAWLFH